MSDLKIKDLINEKRMAVCAVIGGGAAEEIFAAAEAVGCAARADMAEWRADMTETCAPRDLPRLIAEIKKRLNGKPLLFTYRTEGAAAADRGRYFEINAAALSGNSEERLPDIIDIELEQEQRTRIFAAAREKNVAVMVSKHMFEAPPTEVYTLMQKMAETGADIIKLAVSVKNDDQAEALTAAGRRFYSENKAPFVLIAMGEAGKRTRRPDCFFGSAITYAAVRERSAPGQYTLEELEAMTNREE